MGRLCAEDLGCIIAAAAERNNPPPTSATTFNNLNRPRRNGFCHADRHQRVVSNAPTQAAPPSVTLAVFMTPVGITSASGGDRSDAIIAGCGRSHRYSSSSSKRSSIGSPSLRSRRARLEQHWRSQRRDRVLPGDAPIVRRISQTRWISATPGVRATSHSPARRRWHCSGVGSAHSRQARSSSAPESCANTASPSSVSR